MSGYVTLLEYNRTTDRWSGRWVVELTSDFEYSLGAGNSPLVIRVPSGFRTDLASIPWALRWVFPPDGPYARAAVLHDWEYALGRFPRSLCDVIFWDAMTNRDLPPEMRVAPITAVCVYLAVRAFGWGPYRKYRRLIPR